MPRAKIKIYCVSLLFVIQFVTTPRCAEQQFIEGSSEHALSGPLSAALKAKSQALAIDSFSHALAFWLSTHYSGEEVDYHNPATLSFLSKLAEKNITHTSIKSTVKNRIYKLQIICSVDSIPGFIAEHNQTYDSLALKEYKQAIYYREQGDRYRYFQEMLKSLHYAYAHIGKPMTFQQENVELAFLPFVRNMAQESLDKIGMTFNTPVISGKAGQLPEKEVIITVTDSVVLPHFPLTFRNSTTTASFMLSTGADGSISLAKIKVPFTPRGSILYLQPNLGLLIDTGVVITAGGLGLKLTEENNQSLMYNITKTPCILKYSFTTAPGIEVPQNFFSDLSIRKFLSDSCSLEPITGNIAPEATISIECKAVQDTINEMELIRLKLLVALQAQLIKTGEKINKSTTINEQVVDYRQKPRYGIFFWESAARLNSFINKTLNGL